MNRQRGPLAGVKVLEVAAYVAGPLAGMMLADLGAEVVKVEPPGRGDAFRTYGLRHAGVSALWLNVNRGKRSVAIDLKTDDGRERLLSLLSAADVLIHSARPGVMERLGLDDETLQSANPRLIRASISGYGSSGPRSGEPVYDGLIQAVTGLASAQGGTTGPEMLVPIVADKITALMASQAVLAALAGRTDSAQGVQISISMLDAAAYWNFPDLLQDRTFLDDDATLTTPRSPLVKTADGAVVVVPVSGRQIARTSVALGRPDWNDDLRQIQNPSTLMQELFDRVESVTATLATDDVLEKLRTHDVPSAKVMSIDEHLVDGQVLRNELYDIEVDDLAGRVRVIRHPALIDGAPLRAPYRNPSVGEDTADVTSRWAGE